MLVDISVRLYKIDRGCYVIVGAMVFIIKHLKI